MSRPHAAVSATVNGQAATYCYDANGNQVRRTIGGAVSNLTYDEENRLIGVSGATSASFVYDGDGNRVKATLGGVTTYYVGNYLEWRGNTTTMTRYYYADGQRIAMRQGSSTVYFLLGDHLGSTSVTATSTGAKYAEQRYYPWGGTRWPDNPLTPTARRYTGQIEDAAIGLYFYNARYYDPALGRFIQADTIIPDPANPQSLNRYAYTLNNPLRYTDPSGHLPIPLLILAGAAVFFTSCSVSSPSSANVRIEHSTQRPAIDNPNVVLENISASSGTIVGSRSILSHGHFGHFQNPNNTAEEVKVAGQTFSIRSVQVPYVDAGTTLFVLPDASVNLSPAARLGDPASLKPGYRVTVHYWDDENNQFARFNTRIDSILDNGEFRVQDRNRLINPGDSGGGVYYRNKLIGNIRSFEADANGNKLGMIRVVPLPSGIADLVQ